ncbi:hypothetical protein CHCC20335_0104 [Bacillus paralicheniformis]|nr:hypothetical protein CHCC20335_0104 [Bacillus paralicheniformis]
MYLHQAEINHHHEKGVKSDRQTLMFLYRESFSTVLANPDMRMLS